MNLTQDAAKEFFTDLYPRMADAWQRAWQMQLQQFQHPYLLSSCRAHILQNLAFGFAQETLCSEADRITKFEVQNQQLIRFGDIVIVGFKKLNDEGFSARSYPTTRMRQYYRQEELPDIGSAPRLVCGLKLTADWTEVVGVYLMHPKNHREHNWVLNLSTGCSDIDLEQTKIEFQDNEQFFTAPPARKQGAQRVNDKAGNGRARDSGPRPNAG